MTDTGPLLMLAAFQVKHVLGDFVLQNGFILQNRRIWGHAGGILHVLIHAGLTLPILVAAGLPLLLMLALTLAEAVFHYHLDWAKDRWIHRRGWTPKDRPFWLLTGTDQALHQLSYLVITAAATG